MKNTMVDDNIFSKIGKMIDDHRSKRLKIVHEILTSYLVEQFDHGTIKEEIENDKTCFEIVTLNDLNNTLEDDEWFTIDEDYIQTYLDEFTFHEGKIFWEYTDWRYLIHLKKSDR